ncbi:UDP-N-acetylmuramate dehydrogenase [Lyticum sinuosum]|uniref:UDP-N-acetylenolpyruvoylglucosamine reductase n=1 Tax=Lyticum sinuosum TaxID=1332059 RepID=A0AAE4VJH0_9RICK|nr:UDP-N-acetylmuramate dehydrogenase [Lyticum sinuosum]MDZ5760941.1 UDP-N-acetylenolpyruvoylglucosamine reductase [Lyticum sinuosum]
MSEIDIKNINTNELISIISNLGIIGKIREKARLPCWFQVGGPADLLFIPNDVSDLEKLLKFLNGKIKIEVIGVGSNILIRDGGIRGLVVKLGKGFNDIKKIDNEYQIIDNEIFFNNQKIYKHNTISHDINTKIVFLRVGARTLDMDLANYTVESGIEGLEFYAGIPGTIGGAIAMNAGAYNSDTSKSLVSVLGINKNNGKLKRFFNNEIGFDYRSNKLSKEWIFLEADFMGFISSKEIVLSRVLNIQNTRKETQPITSKTCGSTFSNPDKHSAWKLIDISGCRGLKIGGAVISSLHSNFIINEDNASSEDIENLIYLVEKKVKNLTKIKLKKEIIILGDKLY